MDQSAIGHPFVRAQDVPGSHWYEYEYEENSPSTNRAMEIQLSLSPPCSIVLWSTRLEVRLLGLDSGFITCEYVILGTLLEFCVTQLLLIKWENILYWK